MQSFISEKTIQEPYAVQGKDIRPTIFLFIKSEYPDFSELSYISRDELNEYRKKYLDFLLKEERDQLLLVDESILETINTHSILSEKIDDDEVETTLTFGERLADKIAAFGGSWTFIISFFSFILFWMLLNIIVLKSNAFDTYPFILLNLMLSCLAALQAPVIMMSQNRQEKKDRIQSDHDYHVDKKAELEIRLLNQKIDHLMVQQNKKLLEIQEVQVDYLEDLLNNLKK